MKLKAGDKCVLHTNPIATLERSAPDTYKKYQSAVGRELSIIYIGTIECLLIDIAGNSYHLTQEELNTHTAKVVEQ